MEKKKTIIEQEHLFVYLTNSTNIYSVSMFDGNKVKGQLLLKPISQFEKEI